ncbi:hypothetical protein [Acinetobacter johnsonii]|uniref:hypothetical protein n=1 Tax=Acinetobacter johnsonii TaxID=40214 RepID=UPI001F3D11C6|nr:hypothetical protein [Acinetobacter johnsonii]UJA00020.1 hypothetical protein GBN93_03110 [Acinetobacter johnsonii]
MRITNLFSGFALAVTVLLSSFSMAAEFHAQYEKQKAKSTSQVQSKDMAHEHHQHSADEHAQMLKQKNVVGQPSSKKQAQTQPSKQSKVQKGDHHAHH